MLSFGAWSGTVGYGLVWPGKAGQGEVWEKGALRCSFFMPAPAQSVVCLASRSPRGAAPCPTTPTTQVPRGGGNGKNVLT
mgnify:CR=1 FL=1|jgi:hypothetical protein